MRIPHLVLLNHLRPHARRSRTSPRRIASGLLSADQLAVEAARWDRLIDRYLDLYSDQQRGQITGLVRAWAVDVVRSSVPASCAPRIYDAASPRMSHNMHGESRAGMHPIK
jgi:hypothetical protein